MTLSSCQAISITALSLWRGQNLSSAALQSWAPPQMARTGSSASSGSTRGPHASRFSIAKPLYLHWVPYLTCSLAANDEEYQTDWPAQVQSLRKGWRRPAFKHGSHLLWLPLHQSLKEVRLCRWRVPHVLLGPRQVLLCAACASSSSMLSPPLRIFTLQSDRNIRSWRGVFPEGLQAYSVVSTSPR